MENHIAQLDSSAFSALDEDGSGALDKTELRQAPVASGSSWERADLQHAMDLFDSNTDGTIDEKEFGEALAAQKRMQVEDHIAQWDVSTFSALDKDSSGVLDKTELRQEVVASEFTWDTTRLQYAMDLFDANTDGTVDEEEFTKSLDSHKRHHAHKRASATSSFRGRHEQNAALQLNTNDVARQVDQGLSNLSEIMSDLTGAEMDSTNPGGMLKEASSELKEA